MSIMRDYNKSKPPLRAKGNLSYLEFIALLQKIWQEAHPKIPLIASGKDEPALYPCIVYSLQLRKTHPSEPKPRYREEKTESEDAYLVGGQRFQNVIYFEAIGEAQHVDAIESIIEIFEDFMMEFTPVFKELGVSELVYARRLADNLIQRPGANVMSRTISYLVTTEKVTSTRYERLQNIVITARTWMQTMWDAEPGTIYNEDPRYFRMENELLFYLVETAYENSSATSFSGLVFQIPQTNFRIGDILFLHGSWISGMFEVTSIVGEPYSATVGYTLTTAHHEDDPDIDGIQWGQGEVYYIRNQIPKEIIDEFKGPKSDDATPNF